jgi:hypothetical protein
MTIFDLLLIVVVLALAGGFVIALVQAVTGRFRNAARTSLVLASGVAIYLVTVCIVSLTAAQKVKALGDPDCSDDWCVSPQKAYFEGGDVAVEFRVWSRAKRVTQREYGVRPFLIDARGQRFPAVQEEGPAFDRAVAPDEEFRTVRLYHVAPDATTLDLVMREGFGLDTFVIGASQSLLHPRTVYRFKPARGPV